MQRYLPKRLTGMLHFFAILLRLIELLAILYDRRVREGAKQSILFLPVHIFSVPSFTVLYLEVQVSRRHCHSPS